MIALWNSATRFYGSSIGKKWIVALTGLALVGFIAGHLAGNLTIFLGQDAINSYAEFLKHSLHGAGIWFARIGLLTAFVLHIVATVQLTIQNKASRKSRYGFEKTQVASSASRYMIVSGLIVLCFVIYHLLHYTVQLWYGFGDMTETLADGSHRHDVYNMVIQGFSHWWVNIFYIFSIGLLCWHLSHGVSSMFQTLGLSTEKTGPLFKCAAYAFAAIIFLGNTLIVLACAFGCVGGH